MLNKGGIYMDGRYLLVIENKETGERFLYNPFLHNKVTPDGYRKITHVVPLNEEKYGHLKIMD